MSDDEREGLPSASSFEQLDLCPGSVRAQEGLEEERSEDAKHGDEIHEALAGNLPAPTDLAKLNTFIECQEIEANLLESWKAGCDYREGDTILEVREHRLPLYQGYSKVATGKFDVFYIHMESKSALCIDYKTLYGDHTPAPGNQQLRGGAIMIACEYRCENVMVALIQPNAYQKVSSCTYDNRTLSQARAERYQRLKAARDPDAPRIPGKKQCAFCKARATARCPESIEKCTEITKVNTTAIVNQVTPDLVDLYFTVKPIMAAIKARAEDQLAKDPHCIPGYTLGKGRKSTRYTDPVAIYNEAQKHAVITDTDFIQCMTLGKQKFMSLLKDTTGEKGKKLEAIFELITGNYTETSVGTGSLERIKQ
jgi:hypothetical protein